MIGPVIDKTTYFPGYINRECRTIVIVLGCVYTVSQKNSAIFIFTVTLANVGRFLKFFQCRNQKETAHTKNEKFPTVA